jgi:hypothetical protein
MPETHFRPMEISQNISDITSRFGDRDLALAVRMCFIRKYDRFEVIRDFRSLNYGGNPLPVNGSTADQK